MPIKGLTIMNPNPDTCALTLQVRGDAFLARVLDDGDRFRRLDLTTAEMSSSASWVRSAFAQNERKRRAEAPEVTLQRLQQARVN